MLLSAKGIKLNGSTRSTTNQSAWLLLLTAQGLCFSPNMFTGMQDFFVGTTLAWNQPWFLPSWRLYFSSLIPVFEMFQNVFFWGSFSSYFFTFPEISSTYGSTIGHKACGKQSTCWLNGICSLNYTKTKDGKICGTGTQVASLGAATGSTNVTGRLGEMAWQTLERG